MLRAMSKTMFLQQFDSIWSRPGATLPDKNAKKEFPGLTDEMIREGLKEGKLQVRKFLNICRPLRAITSWLLNRKSF